MSGLQIYKRLIPNTAKNQVTNFNFQVIFTYLNLIIKFLSDIGNTYRHTCFRLVITILIFMEERSKHDYQYIECELKLLNCQESQMLNTIATSVFHYIRVCNN